MKLTWHDGDDEKIAKSGDVEIGLIRQSASGRWRWEIASLPGLFRFRDDARGWSEPEHVAKAAVERLWLMWLTSAAVVREPMRAALAKYDSDCDVSYEVVTYEGDRCAESTSLDDAQHYAAVYGQDGPVHIVEVRRRKI